MVAASSAEARAVQHVGSPHTASDLDQDCAKSAGQKIEAFRKNGSLESLMADVLQRSSQDGFIAAEPDGRQADAEASAVGFQIVAVTSIWVIAADYPKKSKKSAEESIAGFSSVPDYLSSGLKHPL